MSSIRFVPYEQKYQEDCINLFTTNLGDYFAKEEIIDYQKFLKDQAATSTYFVGIDEARNKNSNHVKIVACGGWGHKSEGCVLRWGMVARDYHQTGLGTRLLMFRLNAIKQKYGPIDVMIKTSGQAHGFFQKYGFNVEKIIPEGIAKGIDEYQMKRPA